METSEIRAQVPKAVMLKLQSHYGVATNIRVLEEALTVLNWIVDERNKGRDIYSATSDGKDVTRLTR